jgi:hypothetical protein
MTTKLGWHSILQVLVTAGQIGNAAALMYQETNPKLAVAIATVVGCIQVILHQYAYAGAPPLTNPPAPPAPPAAPSGTGMAGTAACVVFLLCFGIGVARGQTTTSAPAPSTPAPTAFPSTTYNFNLTPITLPGAKTSLTGAESDIKIKITPNFDLGETSLIGPDYVFLGGRGDYVIPQFSKWLQNVSPTLNGYQFQLGLTGSIGVIRTPVGVGTSQSHWGQRAGMFLNYSVSGNVGLGLEGQWCNLPGYAHTTYSVAFGPNFHF